MQARPHVVVVGSYAVGLVMRTARIPARGETVVGHGYQRMHGGKGSNQAIACARLGARTTFLAAVGDDADGAAALALLESEGVETAYVRRVPDASTGVGFILVDGQGHNAIAVDLGANRLLSPADIDRAESLIAAADIVLTQLEIAPETALYALRVARRHGVPTVLNPAPASPLSSADLSFVDVLTPNLSEATLLTQLPGVQPAALATALRESGVASVIVTLGEEGALLLDETGVTCVPAYPTEPVDTTGAGDAFSAALAVAMGEGRTLADAVHFACAAGAYSVRSLGTVPSYATRATLEAFMQQPKPR